MSCRRRSCLPLACPGLIALVVALAAPAATAAANASSKSPQAIAGYWTPDRMQSAKPRQLTRPDGHGTSKITDWSRTAVPLVNGAYAGQYKTNGKVFFTLGGSNWVCSGTAVAATSNVNLVWTAGHCVTDGGGVYATNFMFVPGYYNGSYPYDRWTATAANLRSTPGWNAQGLDRFTYDVGAARVTDVDTSGRTFATTIGTRPIAFGQDPTTGHLMSFGYPAAGRFKGNQQYQCWSPFRSWDGTAFVDPMRISCDMTGGSSGGGWILDGNDDGQMQATEPLISVNSYGYSGDSKTMYGPYMPSSSQAQALYAAMK